MQICQEQIVSTQSNFLFDRLNDFVDKGKAADVIHPDFGRVFATILQQIPINKPGKCDLRKATIRFMQNYLKKKKSDNSMSSWEDVSKGILS